MRRTLASSKFWTLGVAAAGLVGLMLLFGPGPDTSAHDGHTETLWRFDWRSGSTVYEWHHRNWYKTQHCVVWVPYDRECFQWEDTGSIVEPRPPCATVPAWSATQPQGSTCDLHQSWVEGGTKYDFDSHRTERTSSAPRCYLPGTGVQSSATSTDTGPPGGAATVYRPDKAQPSRGSPLRCGWWSGAQEHAPPTTEGTTTTSPVGGSWSGACYYGYTVGQQYSTPLPTHSDSRVTGYSYSGARPGGMSVSGSSSLTVSGRPTSSGDDLQVTRGTITAAVSSGSPLTLDCVFRVSEETTTVTTDPRPVEEPGWGGACYEELRLGEDLGTRDDPELPLPWYEGADKIYYSGRRPPGVGKVRIDGEQYLYGRVEGPGTFNGRVTAWLGRKKLSTQDCVIVVEEPEWRPPVCEFFVAVDQSYDIPLPRLRWVLPDRYYAGSRPPGMTVGNYRVQGVPTTPGIYAMTWTAVIGSTRTSITCTIAVEDPTPEGWSGICDWTFTEGHSYTRILPVADESEIHLWSGDEPTGMRMRFVRMANGVYAQQLSGTPTEEGVWEGTLAAYNPTPDDEPTIPCTFEVLPGPDAAECSRTIPSDQLDAVRDSVEWRTDVARPGAHSDVPGGNYLITTGDPGVGGGSPRIWPWWASDDDLTVTDTAGCVWEMTEIISSAHPLFVWYGNDMNVIRNVAPGLRTQWLAMSSAQRAGVEAADRRLLKRVGLDAPEDEKWLGANCEPGDTPERDCVWGIPFPGVWQWSLTVRYRSPEDYRQRDLTIATGTTRFWRFSDGLVRP